MELGFNFYFSPIIPKSNYFSLKKRIAISYQIQLYCDIPVAIATTLRNKRHALGLACLGEPQ